MLIPLPAIMSAMAAVGAEFANGSSAIPTLEQISALDMTALKSILDKTGSTPRQEIPIVRLYSVSTTPTARA
jgi:hypothetical protein